MLLGVRRRGGEFRDVIEAVLDPPLDPWCSSARQRPQLAAPFVLQHPGRCLPGACDVVFLATE